MPNDYQSVVPLGRVRLGFLLALITFGNCMLGAPNRHIQSIRIAMNFCPNCGAPLEQQIPPGDDRLRYVCLACHQIHYQNPKLVVGVIPEWQGRILLCRRAIEPRAGLWTLPAGYLENGETAAEGARRETWEEARARVRDLEPYGLFDLTFVHQLYLMFRARLVSADFEPGPESLAVELFDEPSVPWNRIAFKVIEVTLRRYFQDRVRDVYPFQTGQILPPQPKGDLA